MPEYEIQVAGPIGPVVASALPEFTATVVPTVTVLGGTVACPAELRSVVDVLTAHGYAPVELRTDPQDGTEESIPDDPILAGHRCAVTGLPGDEVSLEHSGVRLSMGAERTWQSR